MLLPALTFEIGVLPLVPPLPPLDRAVAACIELDMEPREEEDPADVCVYLDATGAEACAAWTGESPRPKPPRLPRICGAIRLTNRSAAVTPVSRIVTSTFPAWALPVRRAVADARAACVACPDCHQ
jgi:hypothetical protein